MSSDPGHRAISTAIIGLGKSLGLKVIAEGVEKRSHLEMLAEMKCDEAQGYLFSKPLFEEDFRDFVRANAGRSFSPYALNRQGEESAAYSMAG